MEHRCKCDSNAAVRQIGKKFGISKSTVHIVVIYKIKKHKVALQVCEQYLNALQYNPTEIMAYEANQYATEIYNDVKGEELEIAIANTCPSLRNVDIITVAIHRKSR